MNLSQLIERAIAIAVEAHAGQTDRGGAPYILHPLRLMMQMDTDEERIVAVLHDVVEDGDGWTLERLEAEGFPVNILIAVARLTRGANEPYPDYIARCNGVLSRKVKIADLRDNMDMRRLRSITDKDIARFEKYQAALRSLHAKEEQR